MYRFNSEKKRKYCRKYQISLEKKKKIINKWLKTKQNKTKQKKKQEIKFCYDCKKKIIRKQNKNDEDIFRLWNA